MVISGDAKLIASAFVKARSAMNATVPKGGQGQHGMYVTLAAIVEATTAALAEHGLAIVQEASANDSGVCVETWLVHESGATMQFSPLTMPLTDRKPQAVGSALTYARRYALGAICGLAPDDDDGQAAQDATRPARPMQAVRPKSAQTPATPQNNGSEGDVLFTPETKQHGAPVASATQVKQLDELGKGFYGDEWKEQREKLSRAVSTGAANTAEELTPNEVNRLITGIKEKMAEVAALKAKKLQPEAA